MSRPLVSVIVPAYNRERYLGQALDSIFAQSYHPLEVILADDGSTDGTAGVARSYPEVRLLTLAHGGVSAARNAAIAASRGSLVAFLDSDDLWVPGKLDAQVALLECDPQIGYCFTRMWNFLEIETGQETPAWALFEGVGCVSRYSSLTSAVVRREVFDRIGDFDTSLSWGEDSDWLLRAQVAGVPYGSVPEVYLRRRIHASNLSHVRDSESDALLRIAKKHIDRNRLRTARTDLTPIPPVTAGVP